MDGLLPKVPRPLSERLEALRSKGQWVDADLASELFAEIDALQKEKEWLNDILSQLLREK